MLRYIPKFILDAYARHELSGCLTGFALLFDVADFTPISTSFQKQGKQGAEELSAFLDFVFGVPIRLVESRGGFISLFAGDAFCAIFPGDCSPVLDAVRQINAYFRDKPNYHCQSGDFNVKVRQTVSYGEIGWRIYENELQNEYVFYGEPLQALGELARLKEDSVFSALAVERIGTQYFEPCGETAWILNEAITPGSYTPAAGPETQPALSSHPSLARFINPKYQLEAPQPEIRSGAFCFANLEGIGTEDRTQAIATLQLLADKYGGFVNKYDATDKGLVALILFGIPRSEGKTLVRISSFALEAVELLPQLWMGISCGAVIATFTGSTEVREYTALGSPLNLASRLMSKARPGEVLGDSYLWQELHSSFEFIYMGTLTLKGIENPIRYYSLKRPVQIQQQNISPFVGREAEIGMIRDIVDKCLADHQNAVIYVSGDAGIGKSRLVSEALTPYSSTAIDSPKLCHKFTLSCDMILRKPLEAIKQIIRSHFYYNSLLPKEAGIAMFRSLWGQIDPQDPEMKRIESFLASLLDYEWEGSIWSMLPPQDRAQQLKNAFVYFIGKLSAHQPVLIHLDDAQWLDEESQNYLQALSAAEIKPLIIIAPCRYMDDGSRVELGLSHHNRHDLELGCIDAAGCNELCQSIMRLTCVPQATLDLIFGRSMGNPLFIEQLASYLLETGSLNDKGEIVKELGYLSTFSISDIIGSRIDRLTQNVKDCLHSASVLGMEFDVRILSKMLNSDLKAELEAGKDNLIWKELKEIRYIFSHILIKDIAYQSMLSNKLKELHRLAAEAMEVVYQDTLDESAEDIALHYEEAGLTKEAAYYYDKSGAYYSEMYNEKDAERLLLRSIGIMESMTDDMALSLASSLSRLGRVYIQRGQDEKADIPFKRAYEIRLQHLGEESQETAISLGELAMLYRLKGDYGKARQHCQMSLNIFKQINVPDSLDKARILNQLGMIESETGNEGIAESYYERAYAICNADGTDLSLLVATAANLSNVYLYHLKDHQKTESLLQACLNRCLQEGGHDHVAISGPMMSLGNYYFEIERWDEAERLYIQSVEIRSRIMGINHFEVGRSTQNLVMLYSHLERWDEAESCCQRVVSIFETNRPKDIGTGLAISQLGRMQKKLRKYDYALINLRRAYDILVEPLGVADKHVQRVVEALVELYEKGDITDEAAHYKAMLTEETNP